MKDADRKAAEMQHRLLVDREDNQPVSGKRRTIKVPGGNPNLPVVVVMEAENPSFWDEDMPKYILGILDETITNGWRLGDDDELELLSDGSELAKTRLRYTIKALEAQGAWEAYRT